MKEKTYLVAYNRGLNGKVEFTRKTPQEIREWSVLIPNSEYAILDGIVIKDFGKDHSYFSH